MRPFIPFYATLATVTLVFVVALWLYRTVAAGARSADLPPDAQARIRRTVALILAAWLALAFAGAAWAPRITGVGGSIPITFPVVGVAVLLALGALAFPAWRRVADAIPADRLIEIQLYRVIGAQFVALYAIGSLPGFFALPAGWGDVAVGLAAPVVALAYRRRAPGAPALAWTWNTLGLLDLLMAVGLGTGILLRLLRPDAPAESAVAMTYFPLVLVPTFGVPIGIILHLYTFRALARRKVAPTLTRAAPLGAAPRPI
jgi:hypothetical protein